MTVRSKCFVHKFGGTSVGDARRFASTADIIAGRARATANGSAAEQPVVVVSAMSGVTNALIDGARAAAEGEDEIYRQIKNDLLLRHLQTVDTLIADPAVRRELAGLVEDRLHELGRLYRSIAILGEVTRRGLDAVVSFGERLAAEILAAALQERGLRAQALSATEVIATDSNFGAAEPDPERTRRQIDRTVRPLIERRVIPVITGFIGADPHGATTTLGRGGSDFSAAVIAAGLEADELWIWSDVDGILTADPHLVPGARTLEELSYEEAAELAYYGADVLHPKTIRPVIASGIPLRLLNSFNPAHSGTRIVPRPSPKRERLPAIISTTGLSLIAVGGPDDRWSLETAAGVLGHLSQAGVDVLMFSQSFSEHSLNLVVRQSEQAHCLHALCELFPGQIGPNCAETGQEPAPAAYFHVGVRAQVATVSVVGVPAAAPPGAPPGELHRESPGTQSHAGAVARAFAALGRSGTRVIAVAQAAGEQSVSFCIPESQVTDTVRFLHRDLGLETPQPKPAPLNA